MSKIEEVAKAIYEADDVWSEAFPWPTMGCKDQSADNYRRIARAAIEALRDPTTNMILQGLIQSERDDIELTLDEVEQLWRAMIDAALKVDCECDGDERAAANNVWHAMAAAALSEEVAG